MVPNAFVTVTVFFKALSRYCLCVFSRRVRDVSDWLTLISGCALQTVYFEPKNRLEIFAQYVYSPCDFYLQFVA